MLELSGSKQNCICFSIKAFIGTSVSDTFIESLLAGAPMLIKVNLSQSHGLATPIVRSERMKQLNLRYTSFVGVAFDCPKLERLELSNSSIYDNALGNYSYNYLSNQIL